MIDITALEKASERYAQYYGDIRRHSVTEFAADVRWLTASLFALNAGGLAGVSQIDSLGKLAWIPAILFWLGILTAFAFVRYSLTKTKEFVAVISAIEEQYILQAATRDPKADHLAALEERRKSIRTGLGTMISTSSFLMFTVGVIAIGILR
jgi:hypothetical protein